MWALVGGLAILLVVFIPALGTLDDKVGFSRGDLSEIESDIEKTMSNEGLPADVNCPQELSREPGDTFQCVVDLDDGTSMKVEVTVQNTAGEIIWELSAF